MFKWLEQEILIKPVVLKYVYHPFHTGIISTEDLALFATW